MQIARRAGDCAVSGTGDLLARHSRSTSSPC